MIKLVLKLGVLVAVVACVYLSLLYIVMMRIPYNNTNDYNYAFVDKQNRLRVTKGPKIILVGGSNLAFSVDSRQIQEVYQRPVINTALHAGLGLRFMLDSIRESIAKDDVVVIVPEFEHYFGDNMYGEATLLNVLHAYPKGWHQLSTFKQFLNVAKYGGIEIRGCEIRKRPVTSAYYRDGFNENGDLIAHLQEKQIKKIPICPIEAPFNSDAIDTIATFSADANKRGATCVVLFPGYERENSVVNAEQIDILTHHLKRLDNRVGKPFFLDARFFYDSRYHMNRDGRKLNTQRIIAELRDLSGIRSITTTNGNAETSRALLSSTTNGSSSLP